MDDRDFYNLLFAPIIAEFGPLDSDTIAGIVGFDAGGPISLLTIGRDRHEQFVTYVTCELAVRKDQRPSDIGTYELLVTCDNEDWAREILTDVGQMSLDVGFGHGHTLDIGPWVAETDEIQGVAFEYYSDCRIGPFQHGVLRIHGLTRIELEFARENGVDAILTRRKGAGVYPRTRVVQGPLN